MTRRATAAASCLRLTTQCGKRRGLNGDVSAWVCCGVTRVGFRLRWRGGQATRMSKSSTRAGQQEASEWKRHRHGDMFATILWCSGIG